MNNTIPVTLEEIAQQKMVLLNQIRNQKEVMTEISRDIFSPMAPAGNKANSMVRAFNTGMMVYDGLMMGLKVMKKLRVLFGRRHS